MACNLKIIYQHDVTLFGAPYYFPNNNIQNNKKDIYLVNVQTLCPQEQVINMNIKLAQYKN